jgi:hypothetical protein
VKRTLLSAVSAAALSLSLMNGMPAAGQGLDDAAARGLAALGVQAPALATLTTEQVAQIQNILSSTDTDETKRARIQEVLGNEATATGRLGVAQLQDSVSAEMASLGLDTSMVPSLTLTQLAQIEAAMSTNDADDIKKAKVGEIIGGEAVATQRLGVQQLKDSTAADMARLGIDTEGLDSLTLAQIAQIENVMSSAGTDEEKRAQVGRIMAE